MLIFLAGRFLGGLADHEAGEVAVADVLGGALGEEVDVVLVVFELVDLLQVGLGLQLLLDAQLLVETHPPLVGVDVLVVIFDPGHCLFLRHLLVVRLALLHSTIICAS